MLFYQDLSRSANTRCTYQNTRVCPHLFIPPATKLGGGYTGITLSVCLSVCPSVCRRARLGKIALLGKIARLGIGCRGGYFVPLGQPHSSFNLHLKTAVVRHANTNCNAHHCFVFSDENLSSR